MVIEHPFGKQKPPGHGGWTKPRKAYRSPTVRTPYLSSLVAVLTAGAVGITAYSLSSAQTRGCVDQNGIAVATEKCEQPAAPASGTNAWHSPAYRWHYGASRYIPGEAVHSGSFSKPWLSFSGGPSHGGSITRGLFGHTGFSIGG